MLVKVSRIIFRQRFQQCRTSHYLTPFDSINNKIFTSSPWTVHVASKGFILYILDVANSRKKRTWKKNYTNFQFNFYPQSKSFLGLHCASICKQTLLFIILRAIYGRFRVWLFSRFKKKCLLFSQCGSKRCVSEIIFTCFYDRYSSIWWLLGAHSPRSMHSQQPPPAYMDLYLS